MPGSIDIIEEAASALADYARVPIAFRVERVIDVLTDEDGAPPYVLRDRPIAEPYIKDYDALEHNAPVDWPSRLDVSALALFSAFEDGRRIGGAAVVHGSTATLWDIRIAPDARRRGVATRLVRAVEEAVRARGGRMLQAETQNINVAACRFYQRSGFVLTAVHPDAYPNLPKEVQLIWTKDV